MEMLNQQGQPSEWSLKFIVGKLVIFLTDQSISSFGRLFRWFYLLLMIAFTTYLFQSPLNTVATEGEGAWQLWEVVVLKASVVFGMITVVLAALKIFKWSLLTGIVGCVTYAYCAFKWGLKGDAYNYLIVLTPMQLWALYQGLGTKDLENEENKKGKKDYLKIILILAVFFIVYLVGTYAVTFGFNFNGDNLINPDYLSKFKGMDFVSNIMYIIGQAFYILGFTIQWYVWILTNAYYIWMYSVVNAADPSAHDMLIMYMAYFINSIFAVYFWKNSALYDRFDLSGKISSLSQMTARRESMVSNDGDLIYMTESSKPSYDATTDSDKIHNQEKV